jgi:acyl-CoA thioester hydrolase
VSTKRQATSRARYRHLSTIETRWADNDAYGHVNNTVYYQFFDTAVNRRLVEAGALDIGNSDVIGLVVETQCTYFSSVSFPDLVTVGLKVLHLGNSSVRYEIAVFRNEQDEASAVGEFVHVYVDRNTNRPVPIPANVREVLVPLAD